MSADLSPLRPYSRGDVRAQTGSEAAAFDARAIEVLGVPQSVLMENAGRSAALVVQSIHSPRRVVAVVGAGNNGGDALVVLRSLSAWGAQATAILVADRDTADPLLHGWPLHVVSDEALDDEGWRRLLDGADVIVDGVLGTGIRGPARERQAGAIERMNVSATPTVALDLPSGADATTGATPGAVVDADLTVSFGAPKCGALVHPARARVGRHVTVEIGFPPMSDGDAMGVVVTPEWARGRLPVRASDTHKNRVGRVLIVGGSVGMAGAAILAGRAAFRAGAGLVRICSVPENRETIQAALPEAMFLAANDVAAVDAACDESDAIAVGPGLGTDPGAAGVLRRVVERGQQPLCLDADALNLVAAGVVSLTRISAVRPVLITPHPGEMARLRGGAAAEQPSRFDMVRSSANEHGATVLLKGAPSLVASPGGSILIDTQSSSDLAVAGMGDTLTGVCVALLAQGLESDTAGAVALYLSGRAAVLAHRERGLTPSDVADRIPDAAIEPSRPSTDLPLPFILFDADPAR